MSLILTPMLRYEREEEVYISRINNMSNLLGIIWQTRFAGKVKDHFREAPPRKKAGEKAEDKFAVNTSLI